ncbi:hypothetical protein GCM10022247_30540 [Allokutzneria multivorans]|uniref:OmpR/PhoB-type domain-containing protein n=1 Tax=Allokutzneria multivorans TaxID=1142134 RepID=A0ABP7S4Y1_9PSEU
MIEELEFRVLGRLTVTRGGEEVAIRATKHRVLLACLLVSPNTVVPVRRLIDRIWDGAPPEDARAVVHTYVSRLRATLGRTGLIETVPEGYRIHVEAQRLDLTRFRALVRDSAAENDLATSISLLRKALGEWTGLPLSDVESEELHRVEVARLDAEWSAANEKVVDFMIRSGRHGEVLPLLRYLVDESPLDERLRGQLMISLYRDSNQAEAVSSYHDLRERLGGEPGPALRGLYRGILRAEPSLLAPAAPDPETWWPACQLPSASGDLVGRASELATLTTDLAGSTALVTGPPGIGKTALAIHAAHGVKAAFPDGQLYADLTRERALPRFLRALGMLPGEMPAEKAWHSARYRGLLAGRRVLIVLDNATSIDQVLPVLPMSPGCAVIVTSRYELRGLTACRVRLGQLSTASSQELVDSVLRRRERSTAMSELIELCDGFPLALRIAASNADDESYVDRLRADLSALSVPGDEAADLPAVFSPSYEALSPDARHVLNTLANAHFSDFRAEQVAALVRTPVAPALDQLCDANLLQRTAADRFRLTSLVRRYALAFGR